MANKKISELPDYVGPINPQGEIPISVDGVTYKIDPDELLDLSGKVDKVPGKGLSTEDYTTAEKDKLAGIAAGAEVNVNADWNATSGDAQILNKPSIPSISGLATEDYVDDKIEDQILNGILHKTSSQNAIFDALFTKVDKVSGKGLSTEDYTSAEKTKLSGIEAGAEVNVNADWNATSGDAMILNKPTIPNATGWATENYVDAKIENQIVDGVIDKAPSQNAVKLALDTKVDKVSGKQLSSNDFTDTFKNKLNGIEAGAEVNVNADWNATSGDAQILNKPAIEPPIAAGTTSQYWRGDKTWQTLNKAAVGLGNIDNTSDLNKPISTLTQAALDEKQDVGNYVTTDTNQNIDARKYFFNYTDFFATITLDSLGGYSTHIDFKENGVFKGQILASSSYFQFTSQASNGYLFKNSLGNNIFSLSASGNGLFSGSLTANSFIKSGGTSSQFLKADGSVDNTVYETSTDAASTYEPIITAGTTAQYWRGDKTWQNLDKNDVGLTNVDNTADADKPVSDATQTALDGKQPTGNYITSLTGEATASGPGAANTTLNTAAVTGKVLSGLNITGGTVAATDSILVGMGKLQNQINGLTGGSIFQTAWNANTNTPTIVSSVGVKGQYWIVDVAGTTNIDGINSWGVGDWIMFDGTKYIKVDNTDSVTSVNGHIAAVNLVTDDIAEGITNLYYTNTRVSNNTNVAANTAARHNAVTLGTANGLSLSTQQLSLGLASTSTNGALSSTDWNTFNGKQNALTNPITGSLTTNYLPKATGATTLGNSLIFDNGTNVGIGTTSPSTKLEVNGGSGNQIRYSSATASIVLGLTGTDVGIIGTVTNNDVAIFTNTAERMRITTSGNVGIGTTEPKSKLHVASDFGKTDTTNRTIASFSSNDVSNPTRIIFGIIGGASQDSRVGTIQTDEFGVISGGNLSLQPFAGNVGIGTTEPSEKLNVAGNGLFTGSVTATGFFQSSDLRLKDIISRDGDVIYFKWKDLRDDKLHTGYSAQEVQKINPEQVNEDDKGYLSVNYVEVLVEKMLKLEQKVEALTLKLKENGLE